MIHLGCRKHWNARVMHEFLRVRHLWMDEQNCVLLSHTKTLQDARRRHWFGSSSSGLCFGWLVAASSSPFGHAHRSILLVVGAIKMVCPLYRTVTVCCIPIVLLQSNPRPIQHSVHEWMCMLFLDGSCWPDSAAAVSKSQNQPDINYCKANRHQMHLQSQEASTVVERGWATVAAFETRIATCLTIVSWSWRTIVYVCTYIYVWERSRGIEGTLPIAKISERREDRHQSPYFSCLYTQLWRLMVDPIIINICLLLLLILSLFYRFPLIINHTNHIKMMMICRTSCWTFNLNSFRARFGFQYNHTWCAIYLTSWHHHKRNQSRTKINKINLIVICYCF